MKRILFIFQWCICTLAYSQVSDVERLWINNGTKHSDVKVSAFYKMDSLRSDSASRMQISVAPDILAAYQEKEFKLRTGINLVLEANLKNKLSFVTNYRVGYANQVLTPYQSLLQPKPYFRTSLKNGDYIYHDLRGRISYTPNPYLEFQAGMDHIFIGEGDRSLFLGNQGVPNPFAQLRAKLWKLEYHFIQQVWREGVSKHYAPKGSATHYLSFKANKNWSVGFFESVVYGMKDTLYNRGFEAEYLNPLIFFRPQEYGLGSSDNVIIGLNTSVQWKKNMLYGQFLIDDFFLAEIRARNRWWANKYGFQLGYKTWIDKGEKHFFIRSEFNLVRPFTYSQMNRNVVYGNQGLPSAHPLGSNFIEFYQEVSFQQQDWKVQVWAQAYLKGLDSTNQNISFGGDIYQAYTLRSEDYNFTIGKGITYRALQIGTQVSRKILGDHLWLFAEPRLIISNLESQIDTRFYFTIGFHRALGADRRNF